MGRPYSHITLDERRKIERWRNAKISVELIAERLGRHRSTIFREVQRNAFHDRSMLHVAGYFALAANIAAKERRSSQRKLVRYPELTSIIADRIKAGWTPEQIAGRMIHDGAPLRVCKETIYRFVYSPAGRQRDLWWYLPEHRRKRRPRRARRRQAPKFARDISILFRPDVVAHRKEFGHWEGDLMMFRQCFGRWNVTSLVERISRYTVILLNQSRHSRPVIGKITNVLGALPAHARRSVTFDRGTEFMDWPQLQSRIGAQAWFCDPSSPWRKGAVENANRRARRWLPRALDPSKLSEDDVGDICARLNETPRKCLGWRTPAEVFQENVLDGPA